MNDDRAEAARRNREKYPDIAAFVDAMNAPFTVEKIVKDGKWTKTVKVHHPRGFDVRVLSIRETEQE